MRRTMKNFAKVIEKKERDAWSSLKYMEEKYGITSVRYQKALSGWAELYGVLLMLESQEVFDTYETWVNY